MLPRQLGRSHHDIYSKPQRALSFRSYFGEFPRVDLDGKSFGVRYSPRKQTFAAMGGMSAKCHKRKSSV